MCSYWLPAPGSSCRNFKTCTPRRGLRKASSSSGKNDRRNSELSEQRFEAAWSRRGGRSCASMHDDKRGAQARSDDGHKLLVGNIQDTTGNSPGVSFRHQFEPQVLISSNLQNSANASTYAFSLLLVLPFLSRIVRASSPL